MNMERNEFVVDKRVKTQKAKREDHNHFIGWLVCVKEYIPPTLMAAPLMFYDTITVCPKYDKGWLKITLKKQKGNHLQIG